MGRIRVIVILASWEKSNHLIMISENISQYPRIKYSLWFNKNRIYGEMIGWYILIDRAHILLRRFVAVKLF